MTSINKKPLILPLHEIESFTINITIITYIFIREQEKSKQIHGNHTDLMTSYQRICSHSDFWPFLYI